MRRITLIKSMLSSLPTNFMSLLAMPIYIANILEKLVIFFVGGKAAKLNAFAPLFV